MQSPGVLFPKLGDHVELGWAGFTLLMTPVKQGAPLVHSVRIGSRWDLFPLRELWGVGKRGQTRHPLALEVFWRWGVVTGCLSATLPSLPLLPGSLRPPQVTSLGLFFAGLGCPRGGEGAGSKEGERSGCVSTISGASAPALLGLAATLFQRDQSLGITGPRRPHGISSPGAKIGLHALTLSPSVLPQSIRARLASELKQNWGFLACMEKLRQDKGPGFPRDTTHTGPSADDGGCAGLPGPRNASLGVPALSLLPHLIFQVLGIAGSLSGGRDGQGDKVCPVAGRGRQMQPRGTGGQYVVEVGFKPRTRVPGTLPHFPRGPEPLGPSLEGPQSASLALLSLSAC